MKLSKCKNCILIVYGIIIVCLWIENLNIDTKEFAVPGSSQTFDDRAWENLNVLLNAFVSSSGTELGGSVFSVKRRPKLTLPSNIHIKGNLLVGSYNCDSANHNGQCNGDSSTFSDSKPIINTYSSIYPEPDDSTLTGNIYSWNAKHSEVDTLFIHRGHFERDKLWFQSQASFIEREAVDNDIECVSIKTNKIYGAMNAGGVRSLELLSPIRTLFVNQPFSYPTSNWHADEWGSGKTNSVNASLMVTGKTDVKGKLTVGGDVRIWDIPTYTQDEQLDITDIGGSPMRGPLMLNSQMGESVCAPYTNHNSNGDPWCRDGCVDYY